MQELVNLRRDRYSKFFDIGNGQVQVDINAGPVHYLDENGTWQDVNYTINPNTGTNPKVYDYVTKAHQFTLGFKDDPTAANFVKLIHSRGTKGNVSYTLNGLYLYDTSTSTKTLIASPTKVTPTVSGNQITYPGVFSGVDLRFTSGVNLKEEVILSTFFKSLIPTPVNPATTQLVVSMNVSTHSASHNGSQLTFTDPNGDQSIWTQPITATATGFDNTLATFDNFNSGTNEYLYGISYSDSQTAAYPITIDPTTDILLGNSGYLRTINGAGYTLATDQNTDYSGVYIDSVPENKTYRQYCRYATSSVNGYTISNAVFYQQAISVGTQTNMAEEIPNTWFPMTATSTCWNIVGTYDLGDMPLVGYSYVAAPNSLKYSVIVESASSGPGYTSIRTRARTELTGTSFQSSYTSLYGDLRSSSAAKITVTGYNTFTQNAAVANSNGTVTISWVNGGGLVSSDKHRIYYMAGTSLSAATIKANNTYVENTTYSDTSVTVSGLTGSTAYCFCVVDVQYNASGTIYWYEGATSGVQSATTLSSTYPQNFATDTNRKVFNVVTANEDTKRKVINVVTVNEDGKRKVLNVITTNEDTYRKAQLSITANEDTRRKQANVITANEDGKRKVVNVVTTNGDSKRKVVNIVTANGDTKRKAYIVASINGDSKRKLLNTVTIGPDSKRKLQNTLIISGDTRRKPANTVTVSEDSKRKTNNTVTAAEDVKRKVVVTATVNEDTKRKPAVTATIAPDTKRKLFNVVTALVDAKRKVINTVTVGADTVRHVVLYILAIVNSDTMRKLVNTVTNATDTKRKVANTVMVSEDAKRKINNTVTASPDTKRKIFNVVSSGTDTKRKTYNVITAAIDTKRKVVVAETFSPDTKRKTAITSSPVMDSKRKVVVSVASGSDTKRRINVLVQLATATKRKLFWTMNFLTDMKRKIIVTSQVTADTKRKIVWAFSYVIDTLRQLFTNSGHPAPTYAVSEIPDRYSVVEIGVRYQFVGISDKYLALGIGDKYLNTPISDRYNHAEIGSRYLVKEDA